MHNISENLEESIIRPKTAIFTTWTAAHILLLLIYCFVSHLFAQ